MTCKGLHELGIGARTRHLACAACRHRLCNPAVACRGGLPQPALMLQDGHTLCAAVEHVPSCRLSPEFPLEEWHLRWSLASCAGIRQAFEDPNFDVKAQHVYCDGCGLYVGARLTQLGGLRADAAAVCSQWRLLAILGQCWLGRKYLRLVREDGSEDRHRLLSRTGRWQQCFEQRFVCTGERSPLKKPGECGAVLCDTRAVLSREHRWDAGAGSEQAYFFNHLQPGAVVVRNERTEMLCQGQMVVADAYCAGCAARIGWKFCRDLEEGQHNINQVGRFGLVRSSLAKKTAAELGLA